MERGPSATQPTGTKRCSFYKISEHRKPYVWNGYYSYSGCLDTPKVIKMEPTQIDPQEFTTTLGLHVLSGLIKL